MSSDPINRERRQRGTSLLEALIALAVLSFGVAGVAQLQTQLRLGADIARQRSEAVRLGQQDLEMLRSFAVLGVAAGLQSYAEIAGTRGGESGVGAINTRYRLERAVDDAAIAGAKAASVSVEWTDRNGTAQRIRLDSIVARSNPAHAAALAIARPALAIRGAYGRSAAIPLIAKDLGNGSSAFKPVESGQVGYVLDNASGLVTALCSGIAEATTTRLLDAASLGRCSALRGHLLSGTIRFSSRTPPDATRAVETPLAVGVALELSGGPYPAPAACSSEALKSVVYRIGGESRVDSVPIDATAAALGFSAWSEPGDRHVAYHCVVQPTAAGTWSGRSTLVPSGWRIGSGAGDKRICRYSADLDGSGAIDSNLEHPPAYADVTGPLVQQNFLVIDGSEACPTGTGSSASGRGTAVATAHATLQHQP